MNKRNIVLLLVFIFILISFSYYYMPQRYMAPLSARSPEIEETYDHFSISMYPNGYSSAVIISVDDVSYHSNPSQLTALDEVMRRYGAYATYFVIPCHAGTQYDISHNIDVVTILTECAEHGDEISLHGYLHAPVKELKDKGFEAQLELISKGKTILEETFDIRINGFRPPAFWITTDTYKALEELNFSYCSSACIFNVFPYHPKDFFDPFIGDALSLWEIPCYPVDNLAYVTSDDKAENLFKLESMHDSCREKGTPYIVFSHLSTLFYQDETTGAYEGLEVLDTFISNAKSDNAWFTTIDRYMDWYESLSTLEISSVAENGILSILMESDDIIEGLTLTLDLPDSIQEVNIYYNGSLYYQFIDCDSKKIIII